MGHEGGYACNLFPASAGMNRLISGLAAIIGAVPRKRGDEP